MASWASKHYGSWVKHGHLKRTRWKCMILWWFGMVFLWPSVTTTTVTYMLRLKGRKYKSHWMMERVSKKGHWINGIRNKRHCFNYLWKIQTISQDKENLLLCLEIIGSLESQVISPVQVMCSGSQAWVFVDSSDYVGCIRFRGLSRCWTTGLQIQETHVWSLGQEDPFEEGMTTHSSVLAWRIQWTEEPGELQPIGTQRFRHDWSDLARMHTYAFLP